MAAKVIKVKFAEGLYQKLNVIRSTVYVESFIIVLQRVQNAKFFEQCRCNMAIQCFNLLINR